MEDDYFVCHFVERKALRRDCRPHSKHSRKVLTEQLKELEADCLVNRQQYREIPPRVEYSLTPLGKSLLPIFDDMAVWGKANILNKNHITELI